MSNNALLYQGAEAKILQDRYLNYPSIQKHRIQKLYRIPEIDVTLRTSRTKEEAKLIMLARLAGVSVPIIYDVDVTNAVLTMQYCAGEQVKTILPTLSEKQRQSLCQTIGSNVALLHNHDIIHGDLTTSNMLYDGTRLIFIDFGLGQISTETETKAVDLHVLMEALSSTHSQYPNCFSEVCKGYQITYEHTAQDVFSTIDEIVRRGRYRT